MKNEHTNFTCGCGDDDSVYGMIHIADDKYFSLSAIKDIVLPCISPITRPTYVDGAIDTMDGTEEKLMKLEELTGLSLDELISRLAAGWELVPSGNTVAINVLTKDIDDKE